MCTDFGILFSVSLVLGGFWVAVAEGTKLHIHTGIPKSVKAFQFGLHYRIKLGAINAYEMKGH